MNLGANPRKLEPILINSQLLIQKKRETVGAIEKKNIKIYWHGLFKLNKAHLKDKFPLPNIDLLLDPTKATVISTMKRHTTVKELKSFLERVSYIRKFTPRPALVTSGLSKLLKNENVFIWGVEQPNVFHKTSTNHELFAYLMGSSPWKNHYCCIWDPNPKHTKH